MKILLVDAFDSFTHIIYQYLLTLGAHVDVVRSHTLGPDEVRDHATDLVVLGPGPGHPATSGHVEIVRAVAGVKPVLGICLGHQSIAIAFGGVVRPAERVMHGKTSVIEHDGHGMFAAVQGPLTATRYHSLIVDNMVMPDDLVVTARSSVDGYVMGIRHREHHIEGVQFHPESVLTDQGDRLLRSFLTHGATA